MAEQTALPPLTPAATAATTPTDPAASAEQTPALPQLTAAPATPAGLPPLTAAPTAEQSAAAPNPGLHSLTDEEVSKPAGQPMSDHTMNLLDILRDHGHVVQDLENNFSAAGARQSNDSVEHALTGPGTFFGTNPGEKDLPGTENESWIKRKAAILGQLNKVPILNLDDVITPEQRAAHPHVAAAADPVAHTITSLTTPANLEFMGSLGIMESLPKFVESEIVANGGTAAAAAKVSKIAQTGLTAMGAYFTADQIASALESIPEAGQALLHGEYDKAIGLVTSGIINGAVGKMGFRDTWHSIHGHEGSLIPESTSAKAMANKDYSEAVHADQLAHQIGSARSAQLADLGRSSVADALKREQITEYVDAKGNRNLMAARQKEILNPVDPAKLIADQGGLQPLEEEKPAEKEAATSATPAEKVTPKRQVTTLGPATTDEAGTITHPILVDGKEVGHGKVTIDGDRATVDWVGGNAKDTTTGTTGKGELTNQVGLRGMRDLARQFLEQHPEVNTVEGQRIGGANAGDLHPVEFTRDQLISKTAEQALTDDKNHFISHAAAAKMGLFAPEAIENAQKPGTATPEHWASPAAQQAAETATSVAKAEESARANLITQEQREYLAKQKDPNFKLSPKQEKDLAYARDQVYKLGLAAQEVGVLGKDQLRENFVPREADFEDPSDPTKATVFDSHHEGEMNGVTYKSKDYYALVSDYYRKMSNRIANTKLITRLKTGRMNDGSPLAVGGGFVDGQRVSSEGPQSHVMGDDEIMRLKSKGQFTKLIDSGRITPSPDGKTFTMDLHDYVPAKNLHEVRPIGPTPIPPEIVKEMQKDGTLDKLKDKNLVYQNEKGEWMNKAQLYSRVPVYVHPEIAEHMNEVMRARDSQPTTRFGRVLKAYDDVQGGMKKLLLSWSPFHKVTESSRMMESLGLVPGAKLAAQTIFPKTAERLGMEAPKIDYFNLTSGQEAAIRDGIVVTDPRGNGANNVEEGLSGGAENWTYKLFDKSIGAGVESSLKKAGLTPEQASAIRRNINPQRILTDDVFGPNGMITQAKFKLYEDRKPAIATQIQKDHPSWAKEDVDVQAGRLAAKFANDKFGGLNYQLLGRALSTQKIMRRLL